VRQIAGGTLPPSEYIGSLFRRTTFAAFAVDDPMPGLVDLPVVIGRVLARRYFEKGPEEQSQPAAAASEIGLTSGS
jgi:predicted ATP-grasp superfamily ATP-dependent carboligase